jgi:hypothetical protein
MSFHAPNVGRLTQSVREAIRDVTAEEMNALHEQGVVSDNRVEWSDVAECDREEARRFLAL